MSSPPSFTMAVPRSDNDNRKRRPIVASALPQGGTSFGLDLDFPGLRTRFEPGTGILWAHLLHRERACYTLDTMHDMRALQRLLQHRYAGPAATCPVRWLVWASDAPAAWSLGGDLALFAQIIRQQDESRLRAYAHLAIDILHANHVDMGLPLLTVALVQGDAIGGGLEAMLTHDLTVAESHARFGLPEVMFDLFPGMGAYSFLKRRLGARAARAMIEDGHTHDAATLAARGLIDVVCATGDGEPAVRQLIARNQERLPVLRTLKKVRQLVDPIDKAELLDVVDLWVELALTAGEPALRRMDCLARVQQRKRALAPSAGVAAAEG